MADLEMKKVAAYMSPGNRFFAPFYRHTTIQAFMTNSEDTVYQRTRLSMFAMPLTSFRHSVTSRVRSSSRASVRVVWPWWNC